MDHGTYSSGVIYDDTTVYLRHIIGPPTADVMRGAFARIQIPLKRSMTSTHHAHKNQPLQCGRLIATVQVEKSPAEGVKRPVLGAQSNVKCTVHSVSATATALR